MKPWRIILDLDDVLNSLSLHILRHFKCGVRPVEYSDFPHEVGYNIKAAATELKGDPLVANTWDEVSTSMFWEEVTRADLWRTAPKSAQCDSLIQRAAQAVGRDEVYIATSPTKCTVCPAHKLEWIWNNLPSWIHRQYFLTPRKWCLGKPGVLLIDDHGINCDKFIVEGGTAILLPRPWNAFHAVDTDDYLNTCFEALFGEPAHA